MRHLTSSDPELRRRAFELVEDLETIPPSVVQNLMEELRSDKDAHQLRVLTALAELSGREKLQLSVEEVEKVIRLGSAPSPSVRAATCTSLALILPPHALNQRVTALHKRLNDAESFVREQAAAAVGDLANMGAVIPPDLRDDLADKLSDPNGLGFEAAFALAQMQDGRARLRLESALRIADHRRLALEALGRIADPASKDAILHTVNSWFLNWTDRWTGWAVLAHLGHAESGERLIQKLNSRRFEERIFACALIRQWRVSGALLYLRNLALRAGETAREAAIDTLGQVGEPEDIELLERISCDNNNENNTRHVAAEAARHLRLRSPK